MFADGSVPAASFAGRVGKWARRPGKPSVSVLCRWTATAVLLVLLAATGARSMETVNVDGLIYLRIAEYWRGGRVDLALNGYWGPLISWLMVPVLAVTDAPMVAARVVTAVGGAVYYVGGLTLARALGVGPSLMAWAVWPLVLFCADWATAVVTPDLLMAGLLLAGFGVALGSPGGNGRHAARSLTAGVLYGLAYLAKSVALPLSLLLVAIAPVVRKMTARVPAKQAWRCVVLTTAAMGVTALPWIVVVSLHYGYPTFSTSGPINHAIVGPDATGHPVFRTFHVPQAGRVTAWEDPTAMPYRPWSPIASAANMSHQLELIVRNTAHIGETLASFDVLGLGGGLLLVVFLLGVTRRDPARRVWVALPFVVAMTIPYLPVFAGERRYYLPCFAAVLVGGLAVVDVLLGRPSVPGEGSPHARPWLRTVALIVVTGSFAVPGLRGTRAALLGRVPAEFGAARALERVLVQDVPPVGGIASITDRDRIPVALATYELALLRRQPYLGSLRSTDDVGAFLGAGGTILVAAAGIPLTDAILGDGRFVKIAELPSDRSGGSSFPMLMLRAARSEGDER